MIWNANKVEIMDHEIEAYLISIRCRLCGGSEE